MVPSHRQALRACLLSFRLLVGTDYELTLPATIERAKGQSHGRGDPGQPCHAGAHRPSVLPTVLVESRSCPNRMVRCRLSSSAAESSTGSLLATRSLSTGW